MLVQQHLTACAACGETLAIEYSGSHGRLTESAVHVRAFSCPRCRHTNPVFVPLSAGPFVVKVVPGGGMGRPAGDGAARAAPPQRPQSPMSRRVGDGALVRLLRPVLIALLRSGPRVLERSWQQVLCVFARRA